MFKRHHGITVSLIQNVILLMSCALLVWTANAVIGVKEKVVKLDGIIDGQALSIRINSDRVTALESIIADIRAMQVKLDNIKESQIRLEQNLEKHLNKIP